jgi:hypothetical protein
MMPFRNCLTRRTGTTFSFAALAMSVLVLFSGLLASEPPAPTGSGADPQAAPFESLNRECRSAYAWARTEMLKRQGPIILADLEMLTLLDGTKRETVTIVPARQLPLKAVSHVPLALFGLLSVVGEEPLAPAQVETLRRLCDAVDRSLPALAHADLSAEQSARLKMILERCRAKADAARSLGQFRAPDFNTLADEIRPALLANIHDAARLQIDAYHAVVTRWRGELGPKRWDQVRVIVMGSQMPRKGNLAVQYFARMLGQAGESQRIVYAESLYEEPRALSLLGTHLIDSATAQALFGDPRRLDRDIFADAAREYINSAIKRE